MSNNINMKLMQLIVILVALLLLVQINNSKQDNIDIETKEQIQEVDIDTNQNDNTTNYSNELGEVIATIEVPRLKIKEEVYYGHDYLDLHNLILDEDYNLPGEGKNIVIAGHKENISEYLKQLEVGDEMQLDTSTGTYNYEVEDIEIVDQDDTGILENSTNEKQLLIYTCYPFEWWSQNNQRYVLKSKRINTYK